MFRFSPVFCAFGSAVSDIAHIYQNDRLMVVLSPGSNDLALDASAFNNIVDGLFEQARKGLAEDGFNPSDAVYLLELEMRYGSQIQNTVVTSPVLKVESDADIKQLADAFAEQYVELWGPGSAYPAGGVEINLFRLRASIPSERGRLPKRKLGKAFPGDALLGTREAYWDGSFRSTSVYDLDKLQPGNVVTGPALVESDTTSLPIPIGWECKIDEHESAVITPC